MIDTLLQQLEERTIVDRQIDPECEQYHGMSFRLATGQRIKFRSAKITPKKIGQFVTLWKRDGNNTTVPYQDTDPFDYYFIFTEQDNHAGIFIFSKEILIQKNILSTTQKEGKRGFRIYPSWVETENEQAKKTQQWQMLHFIDFKNYSLETQQKYHAILFGK